MKTDILSSIKAGPVTAALSAARNRNCAALFVDIKCRSVRDQQLINPDSVEDYLHALIHGGVDGLSVVTESRHFGGSLSLAARVRRVYSSPLIRKEFFSRMEQMDESAEVGFDAVQLTISVIKDLGLIGRMANRAGQLGLEVIICIQDETELKQALNMGAKIIGINNRDILSLEIDDGTVTRTESLLSNIPDDVFVISESSMLSEEDIRRAVTAGSDGVLIGTAIAKAADPIATVRDFRNACQRRPITS